MTQAPMVWRPHPAQERFCQCDAYEALFGGSKGPGKTETLLMEGLRQVEKPGYRAIILRRTFPQLGEVIDRSFKYFPKLGATFSGRDQRLELPAWTFKSGAKFAFGHVQRERDKENYNGKEFHYLALDQLEQFTETVYLYLMAQNRTSDPDIECYVRSTANPGGVGHGWVKKRFVDPFQINENEYSKELKYFRRNEFDEDIETTKDDPRSVSRAFIPANVYDNPSLIKNDPGYIARLEQLPASDKEAFLKGNWDLFQGQFFKDWRKSIHVRKRLIQPTFEKFLSLDYGYANPSSVGWWMVDFDGNMHRYRELYKKNLIYEELGELVRELTPDDEEISYCVADPAIWGDRDHHKKGAIQGESGAETLTRVFRGFTQLIKADNSRITGWNRVRALLKPFGLPGGIKTSRLTVEPTCKDFIRTFPIQIHDELKEEDLDTDGEDHTADETRYAAMSRPEAPKVEADKPKAWTEEYFEHREQKERENRGEEVEEEEISA